MVDVLEYYAAMRLSDYLRDQGETIAAFSERSGVPRSTVQEMAAGKSDPRISSVIRVVRATGGLVSWEDLSPGHERTRGKARQGRRG